MTAPQRRPPAPAQAVASRPVIGLALGIVGLIHVAITPIIYGDAVRGILHAGVLGAVEADPQLKDSRSAAFWYATAGLGMIILAVVVNWSERRLGTVPVGLGWLLLGLAGWGVLLMPVSPFWVFAPIGGWALHSAHRCRSTSLISHSQPPPRVKS